MLFKGVRAGQEVILGTPKGNIRDGVFSYSLEEVESVKTTTIVVAGFKFNLKDGRGRTIPHMILPATPANCRTYLDGEAAEPENPSAHSSPETDMDDKLRKLALDALRIIRDEKGHDDDLIEIIGVDALAAFRRQWRKLHPEAPRQKP